MRLLISTPSNQTTFLITDAPAMPAITFNAVLDPATPTAAQANYQWSIQLLFSGIETPHGKASTPINFNKTTTGPKLVLLPTDWGTIRGGNLKVTATATINGQICTGQLLGLRIKGTNPSQSTILNAMAGSDIVGKIARQESGFCQFGTDSWPYFSRDNLGGAGIMQITPASEDQRWNWRSNIQAGVAKYNHAYSLGPVYINSVRQSPTFAALVAALNKARAAQKQPPLVVTVPDWTPAQRVRDAVRGYNGWAGSDPVIPGLHLHEYKLSVNATGQLQVTTPVSGRAEAIWVPVQSTERPQGAHGGDPDYVTNVLGNSAS